MYNLHTDFNITGYLAEGFIRKGESIFGRELPIFSATIHPDDPFAREEIQAAYQAFAGPRLATAVELQDQPSDQSLLRFESIMEPNHGVFSDTGDTVQPGDHVTLQVRLEHNENADQTIIYPSLILRSVILAEIETPKDLVWDKSFTEFDF